VVLNETIEPVGRSASIVRQWEDAEQAVVSDIFD
jgi:hypothetical protein